jgi:hypothetical protein
VTGEWLKEGHGMSGFKDLKVWHRSKELAVLVYKLTQKGPFVRDYGFRDQIRRAAVSVLSNIAGSAP